MQYVRSVSSSVSKTWNSLNPATLSGAIDVIVVEQQDGSLACSPFHVRFGKFSLLRPYEKKVEFQVNGVKQDYAMKLGEEGEAFFVFETSEDIPESMQTSPLVSPAIDPTTGGPLEASDDADASALPEPDFLDLTLQEGKTLVHSRRQSRSDAPMLTSARRTHSDLGNASAVDPSAEPSVEASGAAVSSWTSNSLPSAAQLDRSVSDDGVPATARTRANTFSDQDRNGGFLPTPERLSPASRPVAATSPHTRSNSPPPVPTAEAVNRAKSLSKKLSGSNIPTQISESGDLMLDMTGYKSSEAEALRAEVIARKILSEELKGNYDIGALIGADERGNLWIYSSEEAKEAAGRRAALSGLAAASGLSADAASDPGYGSDGEASNANVEPTASHERRGSDSAATGLVTPPQTPPDTADLDESSPNYAKTLRLTSEQLKALGLRAGPNSMSFSVNRATCSANMFYWKYDVPIVISDIDGTITKSDALGHVLNMIGRDWTHLGVAKLYTDIVANGYNIMYLTSRSVGQADTTRTYLAGVVQDGHRLPKGPVLLSPDRTIAALRREIYLRKPEVFKMACLRDILNLFSQKHNPFYAGFGNRLTDALSYRSVNIPSTRIFTINSNAEVSLDLLTLTKYKSSYVSMRELVDHFFPPVGLLVSGGGEDFTDFNFWRDAPLQLEDFSGSDSDDESGLDGEADGDLDGRAEADAYEDEDEEGGSLRSEDEGSEGLDEDELADELGDSYISRESGEDAAEVAGSTMEESMTEEDLRVAATIEAVADEAAVDGPPLGEPKSDVAPQPGREPTKFLVDHDALAAVDVAREDEGIEEGEPEAEPKADMSVKGGIA